MSRSFTSNGSSLSFSDADCNAIWQRNTSTHNRWWKVHITTHIESARTCTSGCFKWTWESLFILGLLCPQVTKSLCNKDALIVTAGHFVEFWSNSRRTNRAGFKNMAIDYPWPDYITFKSSTSSALQLFYVVHYTNILTYLLQTSPAQSNLERAAS